MLGRHAKAASRGKVQKMLQLTASEIMFYGGLALVALACVSLLVSLVAAKIKATRLEADLTAEYGPKQK